MLLRCGADVNVLQEFDRIDFPKIKKIGEERWRRKNHVESSSSSASHGITASSSSSSSFEILEEGEEEEAGTMTEALANLLFAFVPGYWQAVAVSDIAAVRKLVNSW